MGDKKTVLLIGSRIDFTDLVQRVKATGVFVVFVQPKELVTTADMQAADVTIVADIRAADFVDTAVKLNAVWGFDAVISQTELGLVVAAQIAERLGLRSSGSQAALYLKDKSKMREVLNRHDFSTVAYRRCDPGEDFSDFLATADYPLIIKPVDTGGSFNIHRVHNAAEARAAVQTIHDAGFSLIAETFIAGQEFSVEAFSFEGRHAVLAVTEKLIDERFMEIGHLVPARISNERLHQIAQFVVRFLEIVGLKNGPSHTEIMVNDDGIKVIESHNRVGGDRIARLLSLAYGIDFFELTVRWFSGLTDVVSFPETPGCAAAIHFLKFPEGTITRLDGVENLSRSAAVVEYEVFQQVGDTVLPFKDNSSRNGYVIVTAEGQNEANDQARRLAESVVVETA